MHTSREVRLRRRPVGLPSVADFELVETRLPPLQKGQLLVRNTYLSIDPYMRGMLADRPGDPMVVPIGGALWGGAVGRVVESRTPEFAPGDLVETVRHGWREAFVAGPAEVVRLEAGDVPISAYLGALGMPGATAYIGLTRIAQMKEGESVFVSAAMGAVGVIACQIARNRNCRVVGSTGSDSKCRYLREDLGLHGAINYRTCGNLTEALKNALPEGIDVFFDNVGGEQLEAGIANMRMRGRIALCGGISQYNAVQPAAGPRNLLMSVGLELTLRGFAAPRHYDLLPEFRREMARWIAEGRMERPETVVVGLDHAVEALIGVFEGANLGKMLVQIPDLP
jgi:NADPH-dependent curcumin reductase CurA